MTYTGNYHEPPATPEDLYHEDRERHTDARVTCADCGGAIEQGRRRTTTPLLQRPLQQS